MLSIKKVLYVAGFGLALMSFQACGDVSGQPIDAGTLPTPPDRVDSISYVNPDGDTITILDTLKPDRVDSIRHIDEKGDTIIVLDTVYIPQNTTLHWVGNSALRITEISPMNLNWLDEDGRDGAWIEIYNTSDKSANLNGYSLVENLADPRKWVFGDLPIAPKSFRIVFCDKKDITSVPGSVQDQKDAEGNTLHYRAHTNWKLEKDGGSIYLIDSYYGIRDSVHFPVLEPGVSYGMVDGGAWKFFDKNTPEQANTAETAYDAMAPELDFSQLKSGFFDEPITLNAPNFGDGIKVRCTQNGSEPTKDSPEFNQPMTIDKSMTLRCASFKDGTLSKKVVTRNFFIGEDVSMPVVAVSVDSVFFREHYVPKDKCGSDDPKSCPAGLMEDFEIEAHLEYFPEGSKSKESAWDVDAGISLMGGWSRVANKKSVAVVMREDYQDGWIHYPLFETRKGENDKYKGFNLRNNGNRFVSDYMEDAVGGAVLEGSGVDYQRSRQVVVFYNGKFWGIHDMRERFNKNYVETNYGIDANTVEMIKILGNYETQLTGNTVSAVNNFRALLDFVGDNDFSGANNASYETVKGLMDVGNFADYMAAEIFYKNGDWPNNNVRAWRSPEQTWKFMIYDLDHGFGWKWGVNNGEFDASSTNMFSWIKKGGGNKPCKEKGCFANLYIKLIQNPDFKRLFLNHSAVLFENYVNGSNVEKAVAKVVASMNSTDIQRDLEKFKQEEKYYPDGFSKDGQILVTWAKKRDASVLEDYQGEFGVSNMIKVTLAADGKGSVLVDGMKLPGSGSYTGKFFNGVDMELTAVANAGSMFVGWSDGVTDNPRIVSPTEGVTYTAKFN